MSVINLQAMNLITKIKESVQYGRIRDLRALQSALEDAISSLDRQEAQESIDGPEDNLFDILLEMKLINEKVESCNAHLAKLQQAKSKRKPTANGTAVAQRTNGTVDASVQAVTSEGQSTTFVPAPPALLPNQANPHIRRARVYLPSTPRAVMIYPPRHPAYQPLIRDSDGNVVIALDELEERNPPGRDAHAPRNPLRRQDAFYGEDHLESMLASYGIHPRTALRRQDAFYGERHLEAVHGLRSNLQRSSSLQSAPAGGSTEQTAEPSRDSETSTTVERDAAGASQSAPPSPVLQSKKRALAEDSDSEEDVKKEEQEAKREEDSDSEEDVKKEEDQDEEQDEEDKPDLSERSGSSPVMRAGKRARSDVGEAKEEEDKPDVASSSEIRPRHEERGGQSPAMQSQKRRGEGGVKKEAEAKDDEFEEEGDDDDEESEEEDEDEEDGDDDDDDEGEEAKEEEEEEVKPAVSTTESQSQSADPPPVVQGKKRDRDESEAKEEDEEKPLVVQTTEARAQPQPGKRAVGNKRPSKRIRDESEAKEEDEEKPPVVSSTEARAHWQPQRAGPSVVANMRPKKRPRGESEAKEEDEEQKPPVVSSTEARARAGPSVVASMRPRKRIRGGGESEVKKKEEEDKPTVFATTQPQPRERADSEAISPAPAGRRTLRLTEPALTRRRAAYSLKSEPRRSVSMDKGSGPRTR